MKRHLAHSILGAALMLSGTGVASADTLFDFHDQANTGGNDPFGNVLTTTVGGLTITETAWYLANTNAGTDFQTAALNVFNGFGLTVCSPAEGQGCTSPVHQIDNSNGVEFVLFQFSAPETLSSIQLNDYEAIGNCGSDVDMTYYIPSATLTTNTTLGSLGSGTSVNKDCTANNGTICTGTVVTDPLSGNNVSYLLIGASVANIDAITDAFKIYSLTVNAPEPNSFGMLFLPLAGLGFAAAWRKRHSARRA